jgi:hypothetical protein
MSTQPQPQLAASHSLQIAANHYLQDTYRVIICTKTLSKPDKYDDVGRAAP